MQLFSKAESSIPSLQRRGCWIPYTGNKHFKSSHAKHGDGEVEKYLDRQQTDREIDRDR